MKNKRDIICAIEEDMWMMNILKAAQGLHLPDWWICAGFVRSKVWDVLHEFDERTTLPDIDVVYFDKEDSGESREKHLEKKLHAILPGIPWSVKNEVRMHLRNNVEPYNSTEDAIAKFPETATALGVKLDSAGEPILTTPHGIKDVLNMVVRPTPYFKESDERMKIYHLRVITKDWQSQWNKVRNTEASFQEQKSAQG